MLRYKYEDSFCLLKMRDDNPVFYTIINVTRDNADWHLFQMSRDAQLFKNVIEVGLNDLYNNKLKEKSYTYEERNIFSLIMKSYIQFLYNWRKNVKMDRDKVLREIYEIQREIEKIENKRKKFNLNLKLTISTNKLQSINSKILYFVESVIDTRILVNGNTVKIFTNNEELLSILKEVVLNNTHQFKQILNVEDTYSWWA